jgi:hypothetical protein
MKEEENEKKKFAILILVPVKFLNFDVGPCKNFDFDHWTFLFFHKKNADVSHESNITFVMSLNSCQIMVFLLTYQMKD